MKEYEAHRKGEDVLRKCIDAIYKENDTYAAVDKVLSMVAKFYNADRCYLYEYDEENDIFKNTYEWFSQGLSSNNSISQVKGHVFRDWVNSFDQDGEVYMESPEAAKYLDTDLYSYFIQENIQTLLGTLVREGKTTVGFFGIDNPKKALNDRFILRSVSVLSYSEIVRRRRLKLQEKEAEKQKKQLELDKSIIEVLANEYASAFYVDLDTDLITPIRLDAPMEARFGEFFKSKIGYSVAYRVYVSSVVHPDDQEELFLAGEPSHVREALRDVPLLLRRYRCLINGSEEIFETKYVKVGKKNSRPNIIVIGIANREKENREEQNRQIELKEANKRAEAANRAKSTFLFNVSHDIRTPMNAIIGYTNMVEENIEDKEKRLEYLSKVKVASRQLLGLVNDVLDMARIENGKVAIEELPNDIVICTNSTFQLLKQSGLGSKLNMFVEYKDIVHNRVYCDELRLNRIFTNIISNSLKYTKEGGEVHFIVEEMSQTRTGYARYRFTVTDTGIGMSEHFVSHIFDSFTRERSTTETGVEGAGLGMAITKELVDMMGGTIDVQSELGVGTIVTVRIDFRVSESEKDVTNVAEPILESGLEYKRVLLVEDNEMNREIARNILESRDLIVEEANDGSVAVEMVLQKEPEYYDYVLMDIQMPYMDGYKATRTIRNYGANKYDKLPIIAMTANAFEEDKKKALMAGMNAHLAKPINVKELFRVLQRFRS